MPPEHYYEGIKHVVKISTHEGSKCKHCDTGIGNDKFTESINHYINKHNYKLLHTGTETGPSIQMTVALLGI